MFSRPASHYFAAIYFFTFAAAMTYTGYSLYRSGSAGYAQQLLFAAPHWVALAVWPSTRTRWAYVLSAVLLFVLPATMLISLTVLLVKVQSATLASLAPSLLGSFVMLWLFSSYTFGKSSRIYYGMASGPLSGHEHR